MVSTEQKSGKIEPIAEGIQEAAITGVIVREIKDYKTNLPAFDIAFNFKSRDIEGFKGWNDVPYKEARASFNRGVSYILGTDPDKNIPEIVRNIFSYALGDIRNVSGKIKEIDNISWTVSDEELKSNNPNVAVIKKQIELYLEQFVKVLEGEFFYWKFAAKHYINGKGYRQTQLYLNSGNYKPGWTSGGKFIAKTPEELVFTVADDVYDATANKVDANPTMPDSPVVNDNIDLPF